MKKPSKNTLLRTLINGISGIIIFVCLILFLVHVQNSATIYRTNQLCSATLDRVVSALDENSEDVERLIRRYHNINQNIINNLNILFSTGRYDYLMTLSDEEKAQYFSEMQESTETEYLYVISKDGCVLLASDIDLIGTSVIDAGALTREQLDYLTTVNNERTGTYFSDEYGSYTYSPLSVDSDVYGLKLYIYSTPIYKMDGSITDAFIISGANAEILETQFDALTDIGSILSNITVGTDGFIFAIDRESGSFLYFDNHETVLTGRSLSEFGLTADVFLKGKGTTVKIDGTNYYCVSRKYSSSVYGNYCLITASLESGDLRDSNRFILGWTILAVLITIALVTIYGVLLRNDFIKTKHVPDSKVIRRTKKHVIYFNRSIAKGMSLAGAVGLLFVFISSLLIQTCFSYSAAVNESVTTLTEIDARFQINDELDSAIRTYYSNQYLSANKIISYILEESPELVFSYDAASDNTYTYTEIDEHGNKTAIPDQYGNPVQSESNSAYLQYLCSLNNLENIFVFDENGRTIATSGSHWYFEISQDETEQSYEFNDVVNGKTDELAQSAQVNEEGNYTKVLGVKFFYYTYEDADGSTVYTTRTNYEKQESGSWDGSLITRHRSLVQTVVSGDLISEITASTSLSNVISQVFIPNSGTLRVFANTDEHEMLYSPNNYEIGQTAAELGFSENMFSGSYNGFMKSGGTEYFICSRYVDGYFAAIVTPVSSILSSVTAISVISLAATLLYLLIRSASITIHDETDEAAYTAVKSDASEIDNKTVYITMPSGKIKKVKAAASRWNDARTPWKRKDAGEKLLTISRIFITFGIILIVIAYLMAKRENPDNLFVYILHSNWDRGFNFFALIKSLVLLTGTILFLYFLRGITIVASASLGTRIETIFNLAVSISKYIALIAVILYCFYLFGFDSKSLIASAGILSVIIGLGSQSLIADILAGIFIAVEGEFRVGDIVTINEFRGQVIDIGLRTTKIQDISNNIKIFNNTAVSGVINMTKNVSFAACTISIEYGEDLKKVEDILNAELPYIRERIPLIGDGPYYRGVKALSDSSVDLLVVASCNEQQRIQLERDLNRELYLILNKHNINIPFNQITVSYLDHEKK